MRLLCPLLCLPLSASALTAELAHTRLRVEANADGRCPDEAALQQRVAANLGVSPESLFVEPPDLELRVQMHVTMTPRGRGFQATIERFTALGSSEGAQTIFEPGDSCNELATSLVLVLSIAIDPTHLPSAPPIAPAVDAGASTPWVRPAPNEDEAETPAAAPLTTEPAQQTTLKLAPTPSPGGFALQYVVAVGGFAAYGLAPSAVGGAEVEIEARHRWYGLSLGAAATSIGGTGAETGTMQTALFAGMLQPCGHLKWLGLCGRLVVGAEANSASENLQDAKANATPYLAAGVRVFADIPLFPQLFLRPVATVELPILQTALLLGDQVVWQQPPVAISGGVDLALRLP